MADERDGGIKPELVDGIIRGLSEVLGDRLPKPSNRELGHDFDRRMRAQSDDEDDLRHVRAPPYVRELISTLSRSDVERLQKLLSLKPETVAWVDAKNDRELKSLDGAVEFISSSRTAARVLMWAGGLVVAFVGGVTALAKNGIDLFALLRGGR